MASRPITTLFLDIGGVLLTNGWDRRARRRAVEKFGLDEDEEEMSERHHLTFDTYEEGKLTLDEYLTRVVFYRERPFSREAFKAFMFEQSQPYPEMIDLIRNLKRRHRLKIAAVSNEGRDLTTHRIRMFGLGSFIDLFIVSCFVHYRKPDADIYRIALDLAQATPSEVVYIEDRSLFVEVARGWGIRGISHRDCESTRAALEQWGLSLEK
ncbi:MAG: HAD family phosphatase [Candidatus Manganitrophaceae bacterium]|nr:MAG: HAD family phosphatase [Candidatus Manganitrophaceae bacterium]